MTKFSKDNNGFSVVEVLLVLVTLAVIGVAGYFVAKHVDTKKTSVTTTTTKSGTTKTTTPTTANPYAGWKTYCDGLYNYCFQYPTNWTLTAGEPPQAACDAGGVSLNSPDGAVIMEYQNDNNHDGGISSFTPVSIAKLSSANQALSIIGGYTSGEALTGYRVLDNSELSSYPLTVGKASNLPNPVEFTDQGTGSLTCTGTFTSGPTTEFTTSSAAQAWFSTADAKTSLLILQSFYYK